MFAAAEPAFLPPGMAPSHMAPFPSPFASHFSSCGSASGYQAFHPQHHPGHFSPPMLPLAENLSPPHPSSTSLSHPYAFATSPAHSVSPTTGNSPPPLSVPLTSSTSLPRPLVSVSSSSVSSSSSDGNGNSRFSSPERASSATSTPMPGANAGSVNSGIPMCSSSSSPPTSSGLAAGKQTEFLRDFEDPKYYSVPSHAPERQVVVLTSRIKERVPALAKTRWLDQQLSFRQCPYPIEHIEFTHAGDAVVEFISEAAMTKALARPPLMWGPQEISTRSCTEDDIAALFWVGVLGVPSEFIPAVKQALQPFGEVRGEYAPHPSTVDPSASLLQSDLNSYAPEFVPGFGATAGPPHHPLVADAMHGCSGPTSRPVPRSAQFPGPLPCLSPLKTLPLNPAGPSSGMLKLYFAPSGRRRLPPSIQIHPLDRSKGYALIMAKLFTPHGALAPKCADFGTSHTAHGCPECSKRSLSTVS